jgi:MFS transporter, DHA1 family, multidrug resistance protein
MIFSHLHLPNYFATKVRREIEHLYASTAIASIALAIVVLFEPIFLYSVLGFSVSEVLLFFAVTYAIYTVLIVPGAKIASRFGYAHAIFFATPFYILYWIFLYGSQTTFQLIYLAPLMFAIQKALFWPAFHASLARFANGEQRGREFSLFYAIGHFCQIVGPLLGGFMSQWFGVQTVFIVAAVIYFFSFVPLFLNREEFVPKIYQFRSTWELYKTYPARFLGYLGFGEELLVLTIWPIFIFLAVKNYENTGLLVTVATLISTGVALYIGFFTDGHSKRHLLRIGSIIYVLSWLARLPIVSPFGAFITDALSRTSKTLVFIPLSTLTYERAESTHIMPYVVGFEQVLAIGKFLAAMIGVMVFAATGSFAALFIVAAIFSLLYLLI